MNRIGCRTVLVRHFNPIFIQNRNSFLNFGTWWNGDAGWFRRIRGQGPEQHKKYDFLDFKDRPDIAKKYPFLHRFILRRQRDQGLWNTINTTHFSILIFLSKFSKIFF